MLLVESFLTPEKLKALKTLLDATEYVDGRRTAGFAAKTVKNNLQAKASDPNYQKANELVFNAVVQCEPLQAYAYPHRITPIRFAKYGPGMHYGEHFDAALMPIPNAVLRTDLSFTLFLNEPDDYEGGELVVDLMGAERRVKMNAGDLVMYPSGNRHRVTEVTDGCREVAVGWMQSMYASPEQRRILANISAVRYAIMQQDGKNEDFDLLNQAYIMLERMWGNP